MNLQTSAAQACFSLALAVAPLIGQPQEVQPVVWGAQGWLGVGIVDISEDRATDLDLDGIYGVEIVQLPNEGPAAKAGLQKGDVITRFRDEQVQGAEHLARLVRETPIGRTVPLEVRRDSGVQTINVVVEQRGAPAVFQRFEGFKAPMQFGAFDIPRMVTVTRNRALGMEIESLEGQLAEFFGVEQGVLVRSVDEDSPASEAGIQTGDVIVRVGEEDIDNPSEMRKEILRADAPVRVTVVRNRRERTVTLPDLSASDTARPFPFSRN